MIQKPAHRSATSFEIQASHPLSGAFSRYKYPALLFLFTVTVFWKLIFSSEYSLLVYTDSSFQTYPWSQYISEVLHQWSFPFWDMYADGGRSFIGETQTGAFYPLNLLMGMFPRNAKGLLPVSLIEGFVILHAFLASLFMYGVFDGVEDTPFEITFLAVAAAFVYLSVAVHSRTLLFVSTLGILGYTGWFTEEHFADSVGWPIALIAFGIFMIGLSALAMRIDRLYVRQPSAPEPAEPGGQ